MIGVAQMFINLFEKKASQMIKHYNRGSPVFFPGSICCGAA